MDATRPNAARSLLLAAGVAVWGAALYGSLKLHTLDLPLGHGICGPWGCAPAPEALLGYHALWLTLLGPTLVLVGRVVGSESARKLALVAILTGVVGFLALAGTASAQWLQAGEAAQHALPRGLFVVATTPDLPVVPLTVAGLAAWLLLPKPRAAPVDPGVAAGENRAN